MKNKRILIIGAIVFVIIGGVFYFRNKVYFSHGNSSDITKIFSITSGDGNGEIASRLKNEGLISGQLYFYYYLRNKNLLNKIIPGEYEIGGNMTIPEIAFLITNQSNRDVKVTFLEGWDVKKMAERLTANGIDGDNFLELTKNPKKFSEKYAFLQNESIKTLEGYLFPDTYFLNPKNSSEEIIEKMLNNFEKKISPEPLASINSSQKQNLNDVLTLASIIEMEVKSSEDRKIVGGIFWNRLVAGIPLQSDITLTYVSGVRKKQYSYQDTRTPSPYNTYINKGLPPGPIGNPGSSAIEAAINPKKTNYLYFLSDPETGQTFFARTLEEHNINKNNSGL